jgi:hypothetical protein
MTDPDDYLDSEENQQKQTHITFSNPDHPETSVDYAADERLEAHFQAAKSLKESSVNRKLLVGDFLVAVENEVVQGEDGAIEDFLESVVTAAQQA